MAMQERKPALQLVVPFLESFARHLVLWGRQLHITAQQQPQQPKQPQ